MSEQQEMPPLSLYVDGLLGRCPNCRKGRMVDGFLKIADKCEVCGLDFGFSDAGDAPAIIVMTIAGFVVAGVGLLVEVYYQPPYWVHAAILVPLAVAFVALLRPIKGLMIALQWYTKAEEHGAPR